jgi:hypothetical protein
MDRLIRKWRFWITGYPKLSDGELLIRWRRWWHQHWWPSRIRQLDRERRWWKAKMEELEVAHYGSSGATE